MKPFLLFFVLPAVLLSVLVLSLRGTTHYWALGYNWTNPSKLPAVHFGGGRGWAWAGRDDYGAAEEAARVLTEMRDKFSGNGPRGAKK